MRRRAVEEGRGVEDKEGRRGGTQRGKRATKRTTKRERRIDRREDGRRRRREKQSGRNRRRKRGEKRSIKCSRFLALIVSIINDSSLCVMYVLLSPLFASHVHKYVCVCACVCLLFAVGVVTQRCLEMVRKSCEALDRKQRPQT